MADRLRIAFDIDDTLVPVGNCFRTEPPPRITGWLAPERLRAGATDLIRELTACGHEVWLYTTSLRSSLYLHRLFWAYGLRPAGVVNGAKHAAALQGRGWSGAAPSKFPPAFGIDLLVDNSLGVQAEGVQLGFQTCLVSPADEQWADQVRSAVEAAGGSTLPLHGA